VTLRSGAFSSVCAVLAACSAPTQPDAGVVMGMAQATVGADGGVISLQGATITIPPNALPDDLAITVTRVPPTVRRGEGLSLGFEIHVEPSGTKFAKPVTVELPYDPALFIFDGGRAEDYVQVFTRDGHGPWLPL